MNSRILNFFNVKLDAFIVFVSVVVVIMFIALFFLLLDYLKMRKRYVEFMTGESGKSLEYTIYKRFREIDKLKAGQKDNDAQIAIIYDMLRRNYSKVGIYKYDAFNVENSLSGGSISFALTLLNSRDNGFILNVIINTVNRHYNYFPKRTISPIPTSALPAPGATVILTEVTCSSEKSAADAPQMNFSSPVVLP